MEQTNLPGTKEFSASKPHKGHVQKVYEWCKKKYGRSKYNGRYPDIVFKKSDYYSGEDWGYYDEIDKVIFVSKDKHETLRDLVHTIIHEYTHYLQSMYHYKILSLYLEHHENPLEIQAESIADRDVDECLNYLKSSYKKRSDVVINE